MQAFCGCTSEPCRESVSIPGGAVKIPVVQIEQELFAQDSPQDVERVLKMHPGTVLNFLDGSNYPTLGHLSREVFKLFSQRSIDTLLLESVQSFERNQDELLTSLGEAYARLREYYPHIPVPTLKTIVTGLYHDLYTSDDLIVVGIDFFAGEDATFRPTHIPQYILARYNYQHLVPTIVKNNIGPLVCLGHEDTFVSEMIDFGKTYYFLSRLFPCTPAHLLLGYTKKQYDDCVANQDVIWASFIHNESLYDVSHVTKSRFLSERPVVHEIGKSCPGRVGAFIGWSIVQSFMKNNSMSIPELLASSDHHGIFQRSGYRASPLEL